jgi:hypothetical protein
MANLFDRKENGLYVTDAMRRKASHAVTSSKVKWLPCVVCGEKEGVEAHHVLYSRPYDVLHLCKLHHMGVEGIHRLEHGGSKRRLAFDYYVKGLEVLKGIALAKIERVQAEVLAQYGY